MATTSSTLQTGKAAIGGQGGNGMGSRGRIAAAAATAALGLSLLVGGLLEQGRQASPAAPQTRTNPYWVYREDAVVAPVEPRWADADRVNPYWIIAEDVAIDGDPRAAAMALVRVNPYWTYAEDVVIERVNPYWVYTEDAVLNGNPDQAPFPFVADQFTDREDYRVSAGIAAAPADVTDSATLRFREDNAAPAAAFVPDQFTHREDHRASAQASVTGFLPGYKGLFVYA